MKSYAAFFLALLLALAFTGCDRSVTLRRLKGDWSVSEYTITGVNQIGTPLQQLELRFDKAKRGAGRFLMLGNFDDGTIYEQPGDYRYVNKDGLEIEFDEMFNGESIRMDMRLEPTSLELESFNRGGINLRILANAID